jgi:hypothetical protein
MTEETEVVDSPWEIQTLVWAKLAGYPYWPAKVISIDDVPGSDLRNQLLQIRPQPTGVLVEFFQSGQCAWVTPSKLVYFDPESAPPPDRRHRRKLQVAIEEAMHELTAQRLGVDASTALPTQQSPAQVVIHPNETHRTEQHQRIGVADTAGGGGDPDSACEICSSGANEASLLLCDSDGCNQACHLGCIRPPLAVVPEGDWFCPACSANAALEVVSVERTGARSAPAGPGGTAGAEGPVRLKKETKAELQELRDTYYKWTVSPLVLEGETIYEVVDGVELLDRPMYRECPPPIEKYPRIQQAVKQLAVVHKGDKGSSDMSELLLLRRLQYFERKGAPNGEAAPSVDHILGEDGDVHANHDENIINLADSDTEESSFVAIDIDKYVIQEWDILCGQSIKVEHGHTSSTALMQTAPAIKHEGEEMLNECEDVAGGAADSSLVTVEQQQASGISASVAEPFVIPDQDDGDCVKIMDPEWGECYDLIGSTSTSDAVSDGITPSNGATKVSEQTTPNEEDTELLHTQDTVLQPTVDVSIPDRMPGTVLHAGQHISTSAPTVLGAQQSLCTLPHIPHRASNSTSGDTHISGGEKTVVPSWIAGIPLETDQQKLFAASDYATGVRQVHGKCHGGGWGGGAGRQRLGAAEGHRERAAAGGGAGHHGLRRPAPRPRPRGDARPGKWAINFELQSGTKMFIGGLPTQIPRAEVIQNLRSHFGKYGDIILIDVLPVSYGSSTHRGFGFVVLGTVQATEKAVTEQHSPSWCSGRSLTVKRAVSKHDEATGGSLRRKVFVGGIGSLIEDDLMKHFNQFGEVERIELVIRNGQQRGFCFVEFAEQEAARQCTEQAGHQIKNCNVEVWCKCTHTVPHEDDVLSTCCRCGWRSPRSRCYRGVGCALWVLIQNVTALYSSVISVSKSKRRR